MLIRVGKHKKENTNKKVWKNKVSSEVWKWENIIKTERMKMSSDHVCKISIKKADKSLKNINLQILIRKVDL